MQNIKDQQLEQLEQLRFLVASGNIRAALEFLNAESMLRFTALYLHEETHAVNFMLVDRDDVPGALPEVIPLEGSYCRFVRELAAPVVITNARLDPRLANHPAREVMGAYCGVPLLDLDGVVLGTLCQFDPAPTNIGDHTVALMLEVATGLGSEAWAGLHLEHLHDRVERLSDMQELLASVDAEDARAVFDDFAAPLVEEANRKLGSAAGLEIAARVSAVWWNIENKAGTLTVD